MVAGWTDEREFAALGGLDRSAGREERRLPARLGRDRVRIVEPCGLADRGERVEVARIMDSLDRLARRGSPFAGGRERVEENTYPLRRLRMSERGV
jgi:hypothetical protein